MNIKEAIIAMTEYKWCIPVGSVESKLIGIVGIKWTGIDFIAVYKNGSISKFTFGVHHDVWDFSPQEDQYFLNTTLNSNYGKLYHDMD